MENLLSILGSVASIGAAVWAFIEAGKAAESASQAVEVRNEMIDRRKLVEGWRGWSSIRTLLAMIPSHV